MMNNELIDVLRVVIKEELQPIKEELQQLNRRVGIIETRVENIEVRVENIEARVENIEARVESIEARVENIESRVENIESRVENIESRVESIEIRVETIEIDMGDLKETTSKMETKLNSVYEQTAKLTEYHGETLARFEQLATKEDLEYFDKKISEHEREIFKIKNRV